jgi:Predicted O-linked N-acetylglucosamine transferase, SPINDLY family
MRRAGLDPDRVIWLPLAPTHREHLQQYAQVDVALDSFPNGGCTTTCEALWMGVPVITLTGTHYLSRMSTAVLQGAGLPQWCATSPEHYLALARQQGERLAELRARRDHWRDQVMHHPVGDSADLIHHLEQACLALHRTAVARQAST